MNKEEMQSMMPEMMEKMFSGMTTDDKKEMMMGMMAKMKEGIDMKDMMPNMMMGMMSAKEGEGGMKDMMAKMMHGDEGKESMMPEMMFKGMMPHCIKMMMPAISKEKRADLVSNMVSTLMEQASSGMSDAEKSSFVAKVIDSIKT
ncbi:MAG: hypothetical protein KJO81_04020 [Gammaproteobacteria bacterium]|nr:hypothetical protein [Gammaproteobacteria bacterium]